MAALPTGTVTFLFTDIEGSTTRWEQHTEVMRAALARHDSILGAAIATHRGHVFKTVGDAFYATFPTARDALEAALAVPSTPSSRSPGAPSWARCGCAWRCTRGARRSATATTSVPHSIASPAS